MSLYFLGVGEVLGIIFFGVCRLEFIFLMLHIHSLIHTIFKVYWGDVYVLAGVLFVFLGNNLQLNNCF